MPSTTANVPVEQREINVTPMPDLLLVLLVIFMSAIHGRRTVDAVLPQPCPAVCESSMQIVLEVRPGPRFAINRVAVDPSALEERLREIYAPRPEKVLEVRGYAGVSYQQVIDAMDVARTAGVRVIGLP